MASSAAAIRSNPLRIARPSGIAGKIEVNSPKPNMAKAICIANALTDARQKQAKSLELRAAMSMARLCVRSGKRDEARSFSAPVYRPVVTEGLRHGRSERGQSVARRVGRLRALFDAYPSGTPALRMPS